MENPNRMDVPEQFLEMYYGPDSDPDERGDFEEWVREKREEVQREPSFDSIQEATSKAVHLKKQDPLCSPSVWKEPRDMGERYTVVGIEHREDAYVAGYKEAVDEREIYDIVLGRAGKNRIDNVEEV